MNVLVACEESQAVCIAFREKAHNAYSCDIQDCSGGHPEWHIKGDVLPILDGRCIFSTMDGTPHCEMMWKKWDLIIAHPPCTYLSNAGACRLYPKKGTINQQRYEKGIEAREFFMKFLNADCDKIVVENPIPLKIFNLPEKTQVIQPYEYGHPYTKKTYLWTKGLCKLRPTKIVNPKGPFVCGNSKNWKKQAQLGVVIGKEKNAKYRSKTFQGIAQAMAEQWGECL